MREYWAAVSATETFRSLVLLKDSVRRESRDDLGSWVLLEDEASAGEINSRAAQKV